MIQGEIKPTKENLIEFFKQDSIGRNQQLMYFIDLLDSINSNISISLDGGWGSGKTFFVKQAKMLLDSFNDTVEMDDEDKKCFQSMWKNFNPNREKNPQAQLVVYYDSWENDNDEDPILSLVYSIAKSLNLNDKFKQKMNYMDIAAEVLNLVPVGQLGNLAKSFTRENLLETIDNEKKLKLKINEFFGEVLKERGNRLVIIVDELDRCRPNYAVKLLERIKHYFDNEKITFVFSTNLGELQYTIKKIYGSDFNASRYLDRFFDFRLGLAPVEIENYCSAIGATIEGTYAEVCIYFAKKHNFQLREISRYMKIAHTVSNKIYTNHNNPYKQDYDLMFNAGEALVYSFTFVLPLMIGLKMYDHSLYDDFISGNNPEPLLDLENFFEPFVFGKFLNNNEVYYNPMNEEIKVNVQDKLNEMYQALFVIEYDNQNFEHKIGDCRFSKETKNKLIKIESMLNKYAEY